MEKKGKMHRGWKIRGDTKEVLEERTRMILVGEQTQNVSIVTVVENRQKEVHEKEISGRKKKDDDFGLIRKKPKNNKKQTGEGN